LVSRRYYTTKSEKKNLVQKMLGYVQTILEISYDIKSLAISRLSIVSDSCVCNDYSKDILLLNQSMLFVAKIKDLYYYEVVKSCDV